jgi:hypothetical protein
MGNPAVVAAPVRADAVCSASSAERVADAASATPSLARRMKAILADCRDDRIAQIAAGNVFLLRVASALLARWMGRFEYGVFMPG